MEPGGSDPAGPLMRLILSGFAAQVARALAELGLADRMGEDAWDAGDLARDLGLDGPSVARLLDAAVTLELAQREADGRHRLTTLGLALRTGALGPVARMYAGDNFWATARGLADSVRTGRSALAGGSSFDLYGRDPALAAGFDAAMSAMSDLTGPQVAQAYPFRGLVVDVAGGEGRLLSHILAAHPAARGLVLERPAVAEKARAFLAAAGLADRCEAAAGDMFEAVPAGGDVYILSAVVHDWDDAAALRILKSCRRAAGPDARLVLVERVLADAPGTGLRDQTDALVDLMMMVRNGGRERTVSAHAALLAAAGFELLRIIPTGGQRSLVEARPV